MLKYFLSFFLQDLCHILSGWYVINLLHLFSLVSGIDDEPVSPNLRSKSMLAFKSFSPVNTMEEIKHWMEILATELVSTSIKKKVWAYMIASNSCCVDLLNRNMAIIEANQYWKCIR